MPNFAQLAQVARQNSRYAQHILDTDEALCDWLKANYQQPCEQEEMMLLLKQFGGADEIALARALRLLRKYVMVKLIVRDLNGLADLYEVMLTMTTLAEISVRSAQQCLMQAMQLQYGAPLSAADASPQQLLIIGMGKLGGCELNVSSDIDLIFIYPEDGETTGPRKLSNHDFFARLGRRLISMINEVTADGFVFRVDMRLRPYGDSGPLVMSFAALEEYLISQGREWERYAWIKARVVAPEHYSQAAELMRLVQPFVFRKYLDFGAIDSMRKLHAQIRQEVQRRDRVNNIKLGPGGIREIEFTAQVFQLIRGGQDARLRILPTQRVLQQLCESKQFTQQAVDLLGDAYVFLRNLEHRLQYLDDQQTQELPNKEGDQFIIARSMGFADYHALLGMLDKHRLVVTQQFEHIFGQPEPSVEQVLNWESQDDVVVLVGQLEQMGYKNAEQSAHLLLQLRQSNRYQQLPEISRQRVDKLVPQFAALSAQQINPDDTLSRLLILLDAIARRAAYLAFLSEFPQALQRLTRLVSASSWACEYLAQHPVLLDELLDTREIYQAPSWSLIEQDLRQRLSDCAGDAERQLEVLHRVQQEQIFHLLAMDLQHLLSLEMLSDHLSYLADLLLKYVIDLSWSTARKKHCEIPKFTVVAYGKLGGKELGYASDLDLIFLYDDEHPDAQENYARLGQRINALLGSYTATGRLYETDLRLRPNGSSGLLVSSVQAFRDYQLHDAWVWEHQALTRARFCAGDVLIGGAFEEIRQEILCQQRDLPTLRHEILTMRQKMLDGHPNHSALFDIKHDRGGMVDVEFIVQYLVLAHAHHSPQLAANIGNLALLKFAAEQGLIPKQLAEEVRELYRTLRKTQHRMRLNNISPCRVLHESIDVSSCLQLWGMLFEE